MAAHLYNVLLESWARPRIHEVVHELADVGMRVERVGDMLGIVSGSIADEVVAAVRQVPGVRIVAPDRQAVLERGRSYGDERP